MSRVWIVEDDVSLREMIAGNLRRVGFEVQTDCVRRFELIRRTSTHTDVLITSLNEPYVAGLDACSTLCNSHPNIELIVRPLDLANSNIVTLGQRRFVRSAEINPAQRNSP